MSKDWIPFLESAYFNSQYALLKFDEGKVSYSFMGIFSPDSFINHHETGIAIFQFFSGHFEPI